MTPCRSTYLVALLALSFAALLASGLATAEERKIEIPFYDAWLSSPHADFTSEPFAHWNDDGAVDQRCAACHSTTGHLDFIGADGSAVGSVEKTAPIEEGVACVACHNKVTGQMTEVTFPSGMVVAREEADARCMDCHQGRESGASINAMIAKAGVGDDTVDAALKFLNVHYAAAAASRFGSEAGGGYEYAGEDYLGFYFHDDYATQCNDCHNPHTTKVEPLFCAECHEEVTSIDDFAFIRSSTGDFDADGDSNEGIKQEIEGLHAILYAAMQTYSEKIVNAPLAYDGHAYPYFFADTNGNGQVDEYEAVRANGYQQWTPRLARAAYNYQFAAKDPGGYTHNPQYMLQLLNDSVQNLGEKVPVPATVRPD